MATKTEPRGRGNVGRVLDVQFVEVEFAVPLGTRMVIELDGGLRLVLADERAIPLAAALLDLLAEGRRRKGGRR